MNQTRAKRAARLRRIRRVRAKIKGTAQCPRLAVKRTLKHIYAQVIDDAHGKTLIAVSDLEIKVKKKTTPLQVAETVGQEIAERAKAKGIACVVFDRRERRYHGRVKAVAEGARQGGLKF